MIIHISLHQLLHFSPLISHLPVEREEGRKRGKKKRKKERYIYLKSENNSDQYLKRLENSCNYFSLRQL